MSRIYYTSLTCYDWTQQVTAIMAVLYRCLVSFKSTREISIYKFKVHSFLVHTWNLIKHLAIPLCINISIWSYKFCYGIPRFCKVINQCVLLTLSLTKNSPCIWGYILGLPDKEIFLPVAEIFSLAETWILPSQVGQIKLFKSLNITV